MRIGVGQLGGCMSWVFDWWCWMDGIGVHKIL